MHRPQAAEVERTGVDVHVVVAQVELALEQLADLVGHARVDLQAHRPAEAPPPQLELDGGQQVVGLFLLEGEVGVAGDPEGVVLLDLHAREQLDQVRRDDLLERDEALAVGQHDEAGQQRRHLDPGEVRSSAMGSCTTPPGSATGSRCTGRDGRGRPPAG